ncbi:MAG TPA: DUF1254 domain-containing protein [Burkholderiaceae bacterium]|nr:DUF1254 domain-containing protein [Burkholderiaceae bacterium]
MLHDDIDAAFEYAFPLFEFARTRFNAVQAPANPRRYAVNTVHHDRVLSDHRARWITTPNNDTLYSVAWLDLSGGPVEVSVAAVPPGRYWSVAFMDAFTNNFAMLGQRLDGAGPVTVNVAGPEQGSGSGPERLIRAPGNDVWLLARWIVDGPADLHNAHAMQAGLQVRAPTAAVDWPARVAPYASSDPANFLAVVNEMLGRNPVPPDEADWLARASAVGLRAGGSDVWPTLAPALKEAWQARIGPAHAALPKGATRARRTVQGWNLNAVRLGNYGDDYALRASVALGGLGALEQSEAVYAGRQTDESGQPLVGRHAYRMRIPAEGIAADSFWSISMYQQEADGRLFFTENAIGRYSIGDRTEGLVRNADGSIDITIAHQPPTDVMARANWLPAPVGPFRLVLRAYLPRRELQEGRASMPTVLRESAG